MNKSLQVKLCIMMFLEFFVWGSWYATVSVYMTANGMASLAYWPFTVNPIAAIVAPFFVGLIADRYFSTEKILGILHIIGAVFMVLTPQAVNSPVIFILLLLAYNLCFMPTLNLANTLSFHHINDQEKDFPVIRVFGTIGWIIAGLVISFVLGHFVVESVKPAQTALPLYMAAIASLLLGLYCFTLPHTPPPATGKKVSVRSIVGIDALKQLGSKSFYIFLFSSFLICIPLAAYFSYSPIFISNAGFENIAAVLTIGQVSEVLFIVLIPIMFIRLGVKWMLAASMFAWVVRYGLFAIGAAGPITWMVLAGIALHGICYDFFFVTGQIYVDKKSTPDIRGQAQGLIVLVTYGLGLLVGAQVAGKVYNSFLRGGQSITLSQWYSFWWIPAIFAAVVLIFFIFSFNDKVIAEDTTTEEITV